jgi:hypothetical protein
MRLVLVSVLVSIGVLTIFPPVYATKTFLSEWQATYPDSTSDDNLARACALCHAGSPSEHNGYGFDFKQQGYSFSAIEDLNSDGDPTGAGNLDEINGNTQPGWTGGANNIINGGAVSSNELPAEIIAGMLDPSFGTATITKSSDWDTGFQGDVVVTNDTLNTIGSWSITFEADFAIERIWNAQIVSHTGSTYVLEGLDWNQSIASGSEVSFGFVGSPGNSQVPSEIYVSDTSLLGEVLTQVTMTNISDWGTGFEGSATILNTGADTINGWTLSFEADFEIEQIWNAQIVSHTDNTYVLKGYDWNSTIEPGGQVNFGFVAAPGGSAMPTDFFVNGIESNVDDGTDSGTDSDTDDDTDTSDDTGTDSDSDTDDGTDSGTDSDTDDGTDTSDDTGTDSDSDEVNQCPDTTYGPRMLKLLTRVEYQNSIEDLIGIDFDVSDSIPFDALIEGYFNNAFAPVTESHVDAYLIVAEKVAAWSAERNFAGVVDCNLDGGGNEECQNLFLNDFATRVFRRPLTSEELSTYQTVFADDLTGGDIRVGLKLGLTALLTSPQFLYRSEAGTAVEDLLADDTDTNITDDIDLNSLDSGTFVLSDYEMASFLSYTFTGSTPDEELLTAVKNGELGAQTQIQQQIARLLETDRAREHLGVFAAQWLGTDEILTAQKDATLFPDFTDEVRKAMAAEAKAFFTHVFYNEGLTDLFSADYVFVNSPLADFYGLGDAGTASSDPNDMVMAEATGSHRGGLLTMGAFMANHADLTESSPIKRAHNVRERLLCQDIPQPDDTIAMFRAEAAEELLQELDGKVITNREFIATITAEEPCASCHREIINPLGFGFEDYDASGRHRTEDANGLTIDSSGTLIGVDSLYDGNSIDFYGTKDASDMFALLGSAQSCFSANVFRYAMDIGHDAINAENDQAGNLTDEEKADYECSVNTLTSILATSDSMADLFARIGTLDLVRFRKQIER